MFIPSSFQLASRRARIVCSSSGPSSPSPRSTAARCFPPRQQLELRDGLLRPHLEPVAPRHGLGALDRAGGRCWFSIPRRYAVWLQGRLKCRETAVGGIPAEISSDPRGSAGRGRRRAYPWLHIRRKVEIKVPLESSGAAFVL